MKVFLFEIKKLFSLKAVLLLLAAIALQIGLTLLPMQRSHDFSLGIYKAYMSKLSGDFTEEKYSEIKALYDSYSELLASHDQIELDYQNGKITLEEFSDHNFKYQKAFAEQKTVEYILQKSDYYKYIGGECVYFYDTDWEDFLAGTNFDFIVAFSVIFLIISVFCAEYQSNSRTSVFTSSNGQGRLCAQKLILSGAVGLVVSMLLFFVRLAAFAAFHDGTDNLIRNIIGYSQFGEITIARYCINNVLIKSAAWAVGALFVCAVSNITENTLFTAFLSFVGIVCLSMFSGLSAVPWGYVFLGGLLSRNYPSDLSSFWLILSLTIKSAVYSVISLKLWCGSKRCVHQPL